MSVYSYVILTTWITHPLSESFPPSAHIPQISFAVSVLFAYLDVVTELPRGILNLTGYFAFSVVTRWWREPAMITIYV